MVVSQTCMYIYINYTKLYLRGYKQYCPGANLRFEKGGGAVASGARSQDFFGQFKELFK